MRRCQSDPAGQGRSSRRLRLGLPETTGGLRECDSPDKHAAKSDRSRRLTHRAFHDFHVSIPSCFKFVAHVAHRSPPVKFQAIISRFLLPHTNARKNSARKRCRRRGRGDACVRDAPDGAGPLEAMPARTRFKRRLRCTATSTVLPCEALQLFPISFILRLRIFNSATLDRSRLKRIARLDCIRAR
jgi:hypothetical protein